MTDKLRTIVTDNTRRCIRKILGLYTKFTDGNLGPMDLDVGFKAPKAVGLSIDASVIKGGGFLRFDPDKEQYDGILELDYCFLRLKNTPML